jgi:putative transcriptional regulator
VPARDHSRAPNFDALRFEFARLREQSGLSYDKLADRTGLSRMALINLEHGRTRGSLETWFHVAHGLGVDIGDLVRKLDDPRDRAAGRPRARR